MLNAPDFGHVHLVGRVEQERVTYPARVSDDPAQEMACAALRLIRCDTDPLQLGFELASPDHRTEDDYGSLHAHGFTHARSCKTLLCQTEINGLPVARRPRVGLDARNRGELAQPLGLLVSRPSPVTLELDNQQPRRTEQDQIWEATVTAVCRPPALRRTRWPRVGISPAEQQRGINDAATPIGLRESYRGGAHDIDA